MTSSGGCNGQACGACHYQRRRCRPDCILRPYFPPEQPEMFKHVHRLYGVANVEKKLQNVPLHQRDDLMKSIIFESTMRFRYPVHGNLQVIWYLLNQINLVSDQLLYIKSLISRFVPPSHATPSSEFNYPSRNVTSNHNDYVFGGGYSGHFPVVEYETEMKPLEIVENNDQQYLLNSNNLGSNPATENNDPLVDLSFFQNGNEFEYPKKDDDFPFLADFSTARNCNSNM